MTQEEQTALVDGQQAVAAAAAGVAKMAMTDETTAEQNKAQSGPNQEGQAQFRQIFKQIIRMKSVRKLSPAGKAARAAKQAAKAAANAAEAAGIAAKAAECAAKAAQEVAQAAFDESNKAEEKSEKKADEKKTDDKPEDKPEVKTE